MHWLITAERAEMILMVGQHAGKVGQHAGMVGQHAGMVGQHAGMVGQHAGISSTHTIHLSSLLSKKLDILEFDSVTIMSLIELTLESLSLSNFNLSNKYFSRLSTSLVISLNILRKDNNNQPF